MKKFILIAVVMFTVIANVQSTIAGPVTGSSSGRDYMISWQDLSRWNFGVYSEGIVRDVKFTGDVSLQSEVYLVYLSYRLEPWLDFFVTGGSGQLTVDALHNSTDMIEYGGGFMFNVMDYLIADPGLAENKIMINAGIQYALIQASDNLGVLDPSYSEQSAWMRFSWVNEIEGNKIFLPNGIGVFVGPIYSSISGSEIDSKGSLGYTVGMELFYSERVTLFGRMIGFDDTMFSAGLNVHL